MKHLRPAFAGLLCLLVIPTLTAFTNAAGAARPAADLDARRGKKGIKINPKALNFGIVPIGTRKLEVFSIQNLTNEDVDFILEPPQEPWRFPEDMLTEFTLPPRGHVYGGVEYVSTDIGRHTSAITINSDYPRQPSQTVRLKGRGGPTNDTNVEVRPSFVDYGTQPTNTGTPATITIENFGEEPREVLVEIGGFPNFHIQGTLPKQEFTLQGGETVNFIVGFRPRAPGRYKGSVLCKVTNLKRGPKSVAPTHLIGRAFAK